MEFERWLEDNGLGKYVRRFSENEIDFDLVSQLTESDLDALGMSVGAKRRLALAVGELGNVHRSSGTDNIASTTTPERRQLTVLFCDLVGFTRLASRLDPEVLHNVVRVYEDTCAAAITRYEGYVFQRLGDGIVAFFGFPLAHEGEAERAIRSGMDIIESLAALEVDEVGHLAVRIGIATGMVVVSSAEKGAVGQTMNLASRLQAIADVDSIIVSERVQRLAGGAFEYKDLGKQSLKGISQPTRAYRITGAGKAVSRFDAATQAKLSPLVGRDLVVNELMQHWHRTRDGEGQVVLLSGEPGIGKSRILSALRSKLDSAGAQALRFQCSPYHVNSALWPSIDHLERTLRMPQDYEADAKLDKLESLIVARRGRPLEDVRYIAELLSIACEHRYGPQQATPQKRKDETLRVLVDLTEAAARQHPSVLFYEDLHWADPTTLEAMGLLVERVKAVPVLIVCTHRPEFQSRWVDDGVAVRLDLQKLTREQSIELVSNVVGEKALPDDLLDQIVARTDGVPLYVEELTKSILESGELTDVGERYVYSSGVRSVNIPATLRDSLMARLDRSEPVKRVAQIGAVIGRQFSYELISRVSPFGKSQLDRALAWLTDSGLAFQKRSGVQATYTFKHALVRDAAYDSLLKVRRQEVHGKIAEVIEDRFPETANSEPELLARHLSAASNAAAAIPLWRKAGQLALKRMALNEAISHLSQGLELVDTLPRSAERDSSELGLRAILGTSLVALKGWPAEEVSTCLKRALPLARSLGRRDLLVSILWGLRTNVMSQGRVAESLTWATQMLEVAESSGDVDLFIAGHASMSVCSLSLGRHRDVLHHVDRLVAAYDESKRSHLVSRLNQDPKTSASLCVSLSYWVLGYPDRSLEIYNDTLAHARRLGHPFNLGYALSMGAALFNLRGESAEHRTHAEECGQLGRDSGVPVLSKLLAPTHLGLLAVREGRFGEGIAMLEQGLALWDAGGGKLSVHAWAILAEARAQAGDVEIALRLVNDAIEQVERPGWEERLYFADMLRIKGLILLREGDESSSEDYLRRSIEWAQQHEERSWELRSTINLAQLMRCQGKRREARKRLAEIYDWFSEGFETKDLRDAKALLDELSE